MNMYFKVNCTKLYKVNCNLNNALIHNFKLHKFTKYKPKKFNLQNF